MWCEAVQLIGFNVRGGQQTFFFSPRKHADGCQTLSFTVHHKQTFLISSPFLPLFFFFSSQIWAPPLTAQAVWMWLCTARRSAGWRESLRTSRGWYWDRSRYWDVHKSFVLFSQQSKTKRYLRSKEKEQIAFKLGYRLTPSISNCHLDRCSPPGPGPGLPVPEHPTGHQQPADTWHAKPPHVDQTSQSVTGTLPGSGGGLEGSDRGNWGEDEDSDGGSVQCQSYSTAS